MADLPRQTLGNLIDEQKIYVDVEDGDYITHLLVVGKSLTADGEVNLLVGIPEDVDLLTVYGLLQLTATKVRNMILEPE